MSEKNRPELADGRMSRLLSGQATKCGITSPAAKLVTIALISQGLMACVSAAKRVDVAVETTVESVVEASPDQENIQTDTELAVDPKLPKLDLDAQTLESLLLMNLATYQGDWELASNQAKDSAAQTRDYRLARLATLLALRDNDYAKGLQSAELWYQLSPSDDDSLNMLFITQLGAGDIDGAKRSFLLHQEGKEFDSHVKQIAALLVRQKNEESGLVLAQHMVETYGDSAQAQLSGAYVAETFEKFDIAQAWVTTALNLKPGWELAAQMQANLLRSQNKMEERAAFIAGYVEEYPESVIMRINHAAEMARGGDVAAAYQFMQQVLTGSPRNVDALQYIAALAEDQKDFEGARRFYQRALNINPNDDDVRWSLARRALIDRKYQLAERHFNDIRDPELLFDAQIQVANARYELKGLESAVNTLAGLDARTEEQYVNLALARHFWFMQEYLYEEALGAINQVLYVVPGNLELFYARALVAAELKRLDIAEPDLRAIIDAQPEHANALNALGYTLADQTDRLEEAKDLITKALELRPEDAHILDSMGWVAYRLKDFETAIEHLEKAYEASEGADIAAHLGEVLWESGEQDRAKALWKEWYDKENDNRVLLETLERYGVEFTDSSKVGGDVPAA